MGPLVVSPSQLLAHRLRANNLAERLPAGSFGEAAFAGLQDSAPRAALVSLRARVHGVGAGDWGDPSLVQTWAPRGAVFVVPRDDLDVFAVGITPRCAEAARRLGELVVRARRSLDEPRPKGREAEVLGASARPVAAAFGSGPTARLVFAVAGVQVRWDARSTVVLPSPEPQIDEEDARVELARRFLRSLGPATPEQYTRWAAVRADDARATFAALSSELVEVEWPGGHGVLLTADVDHLVRATPVGGVRLLAFGGDPVLQPGDHVVLAGPGHRRQALPPWSSTGVVLSEGRVVAAWGRRQGRVSVLPLASLSPAEVEAIEEEVSTMPVPGGRASVVWR